MNRTKIDWADMTWNPITGCKNGCPYCYAQKIANRFGLAQPDDEPHEYSGRIMVGNHVNPFPFGFAPTFHRHRIYDPFEVKKSQNIFVCSMADLFGDWVPDRWIEEVLTAARAYDWHRFLFLTKNPKRYRDRFLPMNGWYGATATTNGEFKSRLFDLLQTHVPFSRITYRFMSIEPIMESIDIDRIKYGGIYWIIVGSETGNRKSKVIPERKWIEDILETCKENNVPIFMKESLRELMGGDFIQQFPWPERGE